MHNILIYNGQEEVQNKQRISVNGILIESKNNITNQNTTILETEYVTDKSVKPEKVGMLEWGSFCWTKFLSRYPEGTFNITMRKDIHMPQYRAYKISYFALHDHNTHCFFGILIIPKININKY